MCYLRKQFCYDHADDDDAFRAQPFSRRCQESKPREEARIGINGKSQGEVGLAVDSTENYGNRVMIHYNIASLLLLGFEGNEQESRRCPNATSLSRDREEEEKIEAHRLVL